MSENLITQSELESYAPDLDLSRYSAATISGMISRASEAIRKHCNVDGFFKVAVTAERGKVRMSPDGDLNISFRRRPVVDGDVTGLRLVNAGSSQSLDLTTGDYLTYVLPTPGNYLVYPSNYLMGIGQGLRRFAPADQYYEIDYIGGYATNIASIPGDLKTACTLFIRSALSSQFNPSGASNFTQGRVSMGFGGNSNGKDQHIQRAETLLAEYIRRVI